MTLTILYITVTGSCLPQISTSASPKVHGFHNTLILEPSPRKLIFLRFLLMSLTHLILFFSHYITQIQIIVIPGGITFEMFVQFGCVLFLVTLSAIRYYPCIPFISFRWPEILKNVPL